MTIHRRRRIALSTTAVIALMGACATPAPDEVHPGLEGGAGPDAAVECAVSPCGSDGAVADAAKTDADAAGPSDTLVVTRAGTPLGLVAFSPNGRIQPHGHPTSYWFEYGATTAYGRKTSEAPLPPKIAAYYHESFSGSVAGWGAGLGSEALQYVPTGGVSGGFIRYAFPNDIDTAHFDGIGPNELVGYMYPSAWDGGVQLAALSGGDPDMRGAHMTAYVRGNSFKANGTELVFWAQSTPDLANSYQDATARWSNWGFTGFNLTDGLASGQWEKVDYRLKADTTQWTYAGHNVAAMRDSYLYVPINQVLQHLNGDLFHMLVFVDPTSEPTGSIDVDDFDVAYRNRSVLQAFNGGHLVSAPPGGDSPALLIDGWRNGAGKTWRSAPAPQAPIELVYEFDRPVTLDAVQLHQNPDWPSKDIEVLVSEDGVNYQILCKNVIPATHPAGANYAFYLNSPDQVAQNIADTIPVLPWLNVKAKRVKVRILSGYKPQFWGLGEIEMFGTGAIMQTDDDWYDVTTDITGLAPGQTVHYRLAAKSDAGMAYGTDLTFTTAATARPDVLTGLASRIRGTTAKLEGRVSPLGVGSQCYFEYGPTTAYGSRTLEKYCGLELTPRTWTDVATDLTPGTTYHYRLVAANAKGTTLGLDATFIAK